MNKMTSHGIAKALYEAGVLSEWQWNNTRRIVVDIVYNDLPVVYFESLIDEEILAVALTLEGIQVKTQKDGQFSGDNSGTSEEGGGLLEGQDQASEAGRHE